MMDLGSGIALAGFCVSGGAVAITAIRTFSVKDSHNGIDGKNGVNGKNGIDAAFPCKEHSGIVASLKSQERWLSEISNDVKTLLRKAG
jgi:hypothetical protein